MVYKIWYEFVARQYVLWVLNQMWIRLYGKIIGEICFKLIERCEKTPQNWIDLIRNASIHVDKYWILERLHVRIMKKTPEPLILIKLLNKETYMTFFDQICIQVALMIKG